jgi:hypothetical protein
MLALTNLSVLPVVLAMAKPFLLSGDLSWQWAVFAGLWVSIVLYFSDNSLSQGFFFIYSRLKKWCWLIYRRFRK